MLSLAELKKESDLIDEINWDLGPEEAVKLYLEWGNTDWGSGKYTIRSKSDFSIYFVVNCWRKPYYIYLIRRNSEEAVELAQFGAAEPGLELLGLDVLLQRRLDLNPEVLALIPSGHVGGLHVDGR